MKTENPNGFTCKKCGGSIFRTTNTHRREEKIIRRKVCRGCGMKLISCERIVKFYD
jgi:hypothetical protein